LIGLALAALVALAFLALGVGAIAAPGPSAGGYGIPSEDAAALAYVRATGARDVVLGVLVAIFLVLGKHRTVGVIVGVCALAAVADFLIVAAARRPGAERNLAIHGGGAAGCALVSALLIFGV